MAQLKIVLFQPEIPQNTGSAIRLCAGLNAQLHLIRPLGFSIDDKHLARVALGYNKGHSPDDHKKFDKGDCEVPPLLHPMPLVRPVLHQNMGTFLESLAQGEQLLAFSSKARLLLPQVQVKRPVALLFGSETQGLAALSPALRAQLKQLAVFVKIPQAANFRCHNLSNSIAMGAYEVHRQWGFATL